MATKQRTVWAGRTMAAIAGLHTMVFLPHPYWVRWLTGGMWRGDEIPEEAYTLFWALPGSFVAVLAILGLLVSRAGRRGEGLPGYVGWGIGAWCVMCLLLIGPSGFVFGIVPAGLLIADNVRDRRRFAARESPHP